LKKKKKTEGGNIKNAACRGKGTISDGSRKGDGGGKKERTRRKEFQGEGEVRGEKGVTFERKALSRQYRPSLKGAERYRPRGLARQIHFSGEDGRRGKMLLGDTEKVAAVKEHRA